MIRGCGVRDEHDGHDDCAGWPAPGVRPTGEQLLGQLRAEDDEWALHFVSAADDAMATAAQCFIQNHVGRLEREHVLPTRIGAVSDWINDSYRDDLDSEARLWRRTMKVVEEAGEVYKAVSGLLGENPRKGVTHDLGDVVDELLDCAGASLGAVHFLTKGNPVALLARRIEHVHERAGLADADQTPEQRVRAASDALYRAQDEHARSMAETAQDINKAHERLVEAREALAATRGETPDGVVEA